MAVSVAVVGGDPLEVGAEVPLEGVGEGEGVSRSPALTIPGSVPKSRSLSKDSRPTHKYLN